LIFCASLIRIVAMSGRPGRFSQAILKPSRS
jgi:hypothetical protein